MRKFIVILVVCMLASGCAARETFESVEDAYDLQAVAVQKEVSYKLPADAAQQTVRSEYGQLYFCDGYEITVQTMAAGNLDKTLREVTGFGADDLTVIETGKTGQMRYECVWSAAGEGGDMVGRAAILDDGNFHYCMTVMATEAEAAQLRDTWKDLFDSFILG